MSFDIAWENIDNDSVRSSIDFMNLYFENLQDRPDFMGKVRVLDLNFGNSPPSVEVKDIGEPFEEFYDSLVKGLAMRSSQSMSNSMEGIGSGYIKSETDSQFLLEFRYSGNMSMTITAEACVNYPTKNFIVLPFKLKVDSIVINAEFVIAYILNHVNICILDRTKINETQISRPFEIEMSIESEIGDAERNVLKDVGKVEKFIVSQMKQFIQDELVYPNFHAIDISS